MKSLVVYDSLYGNTAAIAQAIGIGLRDYGPVKISKAAELVPTDLEGIDLLVVGSPIQGHLPTKAIQDFLAGLTRQRLEGIAVAAFDTRFKLPSLLSGSAAKKIGQKLVAKGGFMLVPPEGFLVADKEGPLVEGETNRAESWARGMKKSQLVGSAAKFEDYF